MLDTLLSPLVWIHENFGAFLRATVYFLLIAIPAAAIGVMLHSRFDLKLSPKDEKSQAIRQFDEAKFFGPSKSKSSVITSIQDVEKLKSESKPPSN